MIYKSFLDGILDIENEAMGDRFLCVKNLVTQNFRIYTILSSV